MLNYYDFDASEISLASFTIAKTMGKPLVGIPVFPGRAFRHSYIFVEQRHPRAARPHGEKGRSGRVPADRGRLGQRHFAA